MVPPVSTIRIGAGERSRDVGADRQAGREAGAMPARSLSRPGATESLVVIQGRLFPLAVWKHQQPSFRTGCLHLVVRAVGAGIGVDRRDSARSGDLLCPRSALNRVSGKEGGTHSLLPPPPPL